MKKYWSDDTMQCEMAELNRLKKNKNRKYSWPGQLAMYSQTVEVTLYLTLPLKLNSYKHQHWWCASVVSENQKQIFPMALWRYLRADLENHTIGVKCHHYWQDRRWSERECQCVFFSCETHEFWIEKLLRFCHRR